LKSGILDIYDPVKDTKNFYFFVSSAIIDQRDGQPFSGCDEQSCEIFGTKWVGVTRLIFDSDKIPEVST
jgi:hypothetical protein